MKIKLSFISIYIIKLQAKTIVYIQLGVVDE